MTDDELMQLADSHAGDFVRRKRALRDFRYDEVQAKFWDVTTGNLLDAASVDGAVHPGEWPVGENGKPIRPSRAINRIDSGLTVEGSTWWPGRPQFIPHVVMSERGERNIRGAVCYNQYIAPDFSAIKPGDPGRWIDHVKLLWPDKIEHEHFFDFCAHAIQRPSEKINHGLVIAGGQGIGKDTALLPVREGVGEWNAAEISPDLITSQYNGFVKSVLLVVNEVRPHDEDFKAHKFYSMLKPLLAAPPELLPMHVKYANVVYVKNICHVILTTNDPLSMFIPEDDRRLFVMTSRSKKGEGELTEAYFDEIHAYLEGGGTDAVIDWLLKRDISAFNFAAPPPMTRGKTSIVDSAVQVRRTPIDEVFELYSEAIGGKPVAFFKQDLVNFVQKNDFFDDIYKVKGALKAKNFHFKMAERGYDLVNCPWKERWQNGKFRSRAAFAQSNLSPDEQIKALETELSRRNTQNV